MPFNFNGRATCSPRRHGHSPSLPVSSLLRIRRLIKRCCAAAAVRLVGRESLRVYWEMVLGAMLRGIGAGGGSTNQQKQSREHLKVS